MKFQLKLITCVRLDVALVTSLRDGMNLVSYEFVACQASKKGVLILSEVLIHLLVLKHAFLYKLSCLITFCFIFT